MQYDPRTEYKIPLESAQDEIACSKSLAERFFDTFGMIDLRDETSVRDAYSFAVQSGVQAAAKKMRERIFGRDMTTYGVSYISDTCRSTCTYCPIRVDSIDVQTGKPIRRKTLSLDEFVADTKEILADGHSHICFLAGDGHLTTNDSERLIPYLQALDGMDGVDEVILNITPQSGEMFARYRGSVRNKSLQFRVFQETYDRDVYLAKHANPSKAGMLGPKADYDFRRDSQLRAIEAGFDNYGLGVLLGLNPHFLQDIKAMAAHAQELHTLTGKMPARACLPTANELTGVNNVEQQIHVSPSANELAYALAKLAMPEVSIVSSERDTPQMLRVLDQYASNRTVDVQPSVGGNLAQKLHGSRLLKQTTVHPTSPQETRMDYETRGYSLIFKY